MHSGDRLPAEFETARRAGVRRAYRWLALIAVGAALVLLAVAIRTFSALADALLRAFGG